MMHMLLGVDARSIGRAPYRPEFTEAKRLPASGIGIEAGKDTLLYCLPQVSGYIGADIVAGAYVCALQKEKGRVLFIDIGTNGEIVLASQGRILCCSCAAGPALEGMNISSGMRAAEGAIEDVKITPEGDQSHWRSGTCRNLWKRHPGSGKGTAPNRHCKEDRGVYQERETRRR